MCGVISSTVLTEGSRRKIYNKSTEKSTLFESKNLEFGNAALQKQGSPTIKR